MCGHVLKKVENECAFGIARTSKRAEVSQWQPAMVNSCDGGGDDTEVVCGFLDPLH